MSDSTIQWLAGGLFLLCSIFSLWVLRRQYRLYGKLNSFGVLVHILVYAVHAMFSSVILWGNMATIPSMGSAGNVGVVLMVVGFLILIIAMDFLRNFIRWLGSQTPGLRTSGLYRWSRNPQFVGYGLLYLGFFIAWWNALSWLGIVSYLLLVYTIVRVEEEHLERLYDAEYRNYCQRVPRFFGILKRKNGV